MMTWMSVALAPALALAPSILESMSWWRAAGVQGVLGERDRSLRSLPGINVPTYEKKRWYFENGDQGGL